VTAVRLQISPQYARRYFYEEIGKNLKNLDNSFVQAMKHNAFDRFVKNHYEVTIPAAYREAVMDIVGEPLEAAIQQHVEEHQKSKPRASN
jgi:hypothetical protein